jgi:cytoskeletal protein RodZ
MTSTPPTRRPGRRAYATATNGNGNGHGRSGVGDRLRDARELRGLDLYRVERDTKIRHKFLEALEAGEYAELPGDVYARGFLRNYASYLGLDADEIVDEWRTESGPQAGGTSLLAAPQPIVLPRRGLFLQTSHFILIGVVVVVATIGIYFGYQLTRWLSYPTLKVTSPVAQSTTVPSGSTTYTLTGVATSGTTIIISWNGQEIATVLSDDSGKWSYQAVLRPGSNEFDVTAENLDTNHTSQTSRIIILVPVPTPTAPTPVVAFESPAADASIADGNVTVTGTTTATSSVTLTTTYLGPPPAPGATLPPFTPPTAVPSGAPASAASPALGTSASPGTSAAPGASPAPTNPGPGPISVGTDADGAFTFAFTLDPGTWSITLTGTDGKGHTSAPVTRRVVVPFNGVVVVVSIRGGDASVSWAHDGVLLGTQVWRDGSSFTITGRTSVCVNTPRPQYVFLTVNGTDVGSVTQYGGRRLYVDATHPPKNVSSC